MLLSAFHGLPSHMRHSRQRECDLPRWERTHELVLLCRRLPVAMLRMQQRRWLRRWRHPVLEGSSVLVNVYWNDRMLSSVALELGPSCAFVLYLLAGAAQLASP